MVELLVSNQPVAGSIPASRSVLWSPDFFGFYEEAFGADYDLHNDCLWLSRYGEFKCRLTLSDLE